MFLHPQPRTRMHFQLYLIIHCSYIQFRLISAHFTCYHLPNLCFLSCTRLFLYYLCIRIRKPNRSDPIRTEPKALIARRTVRAVTMVKIVIKFADA